MSRSKTKANTFGVVEYTIQNVAGDGHCFFRALYQILQDADVATQRAFHVQHIDDEDEGVLHLRSFVANGLRSMSYPDSLTAIDTLCSLATYIPDMSQASKRRRTTRKKEEPAWEPSELMGDLREMYPFVTKSVCVAHEKERYQHVADMVEDMQKPMYASSMEIDLVKAALAPHHITLLTISANGPMRSADKNWNRDLGLLLENAQTKYVAVLLNRNNVHYKYLQFKAPHDGRYHAMVNREYLLRLLRMKEILDKKEKLVLLGGKKKTMP